jgi:uncharacterized protein
MRVTFDVNLLVRSALHPRGLAREILELATLPPHTLVVSPPLLTDLDRVLHYPRIQVKFMLADQDIADFIAMIQAASDVVFQPAIIPVVPADADDDIVVATAVDGKADVICTRDHHFSDPAVHSYCAANNIRILSDIELVKEFRAGTP